jgi:hydrogenase maturation protease
VTGGPEAVLIGIGNSYRRDDGVGPAVASAVSEISPAGVAVLACGSDPAALIEIWSGAERVVLVDAIYAGQDDPACEIVPGRIRRQVLVPPLPASGPAWPETGATSSHRMGIADAVRLAEALSRLPRRLVAFGVEAADIGYGPGLSPAVAAALPNLVDAVLAELTSQVTS